MTAIEHVPDAWQAKIEDLVARGQAARAIELLDVWVRQHAVTPWAMRRLGELRLAAGDVRRAGCAFFWSGERGEREHDACIQKWLRRVRRNPKRIVTSISQRARLPVEQMPGTLPTELSALGVKDAVTVRGNDEWPMWLQVVVVVSAVALWIIGAITVLGWLCALIV